MKTLTKGNPIKLILLFAVPLLIGNLFQQLYSLSDTIIVGQFCAGPYRGIVNLDGTIFRSRRLPESSPKFRDEHCDYCRRNGAADDFQSDFRRQDPGLDANAGGDQK